jgi:peptide/nickel transport system permease protein
MASVANEQALPPRQNARVATPGRRDGVLAYLRRNPSMIAGLCFLGILVIFVVIGHLTVDTDTAAALSVRPLQPPSWEFPFGTDKEGRNLYAVMVLGTPMTFEIGLIAGVLGVSVGATLALLSAYYGGVVDAVIRSIVDIGLTIPGLMVLIIIAMNVHGGLAIASMGLVVAVLAWLYPARTIRSQVLTIKERGYIQVARLSGANGFEVVFQEILPNLLPYIVASLVGSISAGVLASVGLEVLGLGSFDNPTIGMTLFWVIYYAAIINSWWWWWLAPLVVIILLFTGLFLVTAGLDEFANPRTRRTA